MLCRGQRYLPVRPPGGDTVARPEGGMLWLRAGVASVLSQILDTVLFISISFYGEREIADLMVGQMTAKIVLSLLMVPLLVTLMVKLGRKLDLTPVNA